MEISHKIFVMLNITCNNAYFLCSSKVTTLQMRGAYFILNSDSKLAIVESDPKKTWPIPGMPLENLSFELCGRHEDE